MTSFNFIGVDVSKDKFDAYLLHDTKPLHKIFDNQPTGFKSFLTWIKKHSQQPWVCMEATGHYSELLADFLSLHSIHASVVNPLQIKHFAKVTLARNKNDKADAKLIAHYACVMPLRPFKPKTAAQKAIRELIQFVDTLKQQSVQLKNQLQCYQDAFVKKEMVKALRFLEKRIAKLEADIEQRVLAEEKWHATVDLLISVKGIGKLTAHQLLAYLPDIGLFQNAKQLAAFAGLSPRQKTSGNYVGKTRLSKFGNPRLRKALYMPAMSAIRFNEHLKPFVTRLQNNGLTPKAIIGAVMRKLLHIIFGMLKNNQPFNPLLV